MPMFVVASVDGHLIAGTNLAGLAFGVLGSLFFTYDLLGRPGGPLRWFLQVTIPTVLGAALVGAPILILAWTQISQGDRGWLTGLFSFLYFGVILGTFNGLFVSNPQAEQLDKRWFSLKDGLLGAAFTLLYSLALVVISTPVWGEDISTLFASVSFYLSFIPFVVLGGVAGSLWRYLNRSRDTTKRPSLFSGRGFLIGLFTGGVLLFIGLLATVLPQDEHSGANFMGLTGHAATVVVSGIVALALGAAPGGIIGALTRFVFWWVNSLPSRRLEIIGVLLILVAFVAQAVEPILTLFNVAVK